MNMTDNNISESLLVRYFASDVNDEERAAVEAWIASDDENRKIAEQIYFVILQKEHIYLKSRELK